jgi:hypothetical protein
MNCKDFESMIHEIVSRRVADKTKQLEALEHAGHCLWCALRLDEETKLTERLQVLAGTLQAQRAPLRVEEALVRAFRERTARTRAPLFGLAASRFWRGLSWGLAFAATVAIVWIGVFQGLRLHPRSSASPAQAANNQPRAAGQSAGQVKAQSEGARSPVVARLSDESGGRSATNRELQASVLEHHQQHSGGQVASQGRPESAARDESASELTTDFMPLGDCDDSQCLDEATLVRVTLPAEALMAFGLGMDDSFPTEGFVQADVALGSDGLPFAIRFVE